MATKLQIEIAQGAQDFFLRNPQSISSLRGLRSQSGNSVLERFYSRIRAYATSIATSGVPPVPSTLSQLLSVFDTVAVRVNYFGTPIQQIQIDLESLGIPFEQVFTANVPLTPVSVVVPSNIVPVNVVPVVNVFDVNAVKKIKLVNGYDFILFRDFAYNSAFSNLSTDNPRLSRVYSFISANAAALSSPSMYTPYSIRAAYGNFLPSITSAVNDFGVSVREIARDFLQVGLPFFELFQPE